MATTFWSAGVAELGCRQAPDSESIPRYRNRSAFQGCCPISSSQGRPPTSTVQAMAGGSPWAASPAEVCLRQGPLVERTANYGSNGSFQGCSPLSAPGGCLPVAAIHGQYSLGGVVAPRTKRSAAFFVGCGGSGLGGYTFVDRRKKDSTRASAENNKKKAGGISFGDQLLDYIEGGPKLRKWYGAPDQLPKDGASKKELTPEEPVEAQDEDEEDLVRDIVLVTDAESATGQLEVSTAFKLQQLPENYLVVLELILRRLRVRALVKDIKAATVGFGSYVEPVEGDVNDEEVLKRAMRGVRAVICPTKVGKLGDRELVKGVKHIVLLSKLDINRKQGGLGALFGSLSSRDAEENEAAIASLGIPYTVVRAGSLKDVEGGQLGFLYGQDGEVRGSISREDAAYVCVEALDSPPQRALVFEVANGRDEVEDWSAVFTSMKETATASGS